MSNVIDNDYHPVDSDLSATDDHWGTRLAGDVVPIRPSNSPSNNAGAMGQKQNQQKQSPNLLDPKNSNITNLYG